MLTTGHDPTPVGAWAARNTTANAATGESDGSPKEDARQCHHRAYQH